MLKNLLKRARAGENVLDEVLKELIPKQAEEIKKAVRDRIPIMIIDNTENGGEIRGLLHHLLKSNNAILIPDTVSEFREYNTAYLRIDLNNINSK